MAPGTGKLGPSNPQTTLARFFAPPAAASGSKPAASGSKPATSGSKPAASGSKPTTTNGQAAAAGKRAAAPIDLTLSDDDDEPPPAKKQKTGHVAKQLFLPGTPSPSPEPAHDRAPTAPSSPVLSRHGSSTISRTESTALEKQREKARIARALLADNSSFHRARGASAKAQAPAAESEGEGDEEEENDKFKELQKTFALKSTSASKGKGKSTAAPKAAAKAKEVGPSGQEYTPLELQVKRLKEKHPDLLLMILVGYKYKFYGADAEAAAKHLGIVAYPDRNYTCASIPEARLNVHVKKLLSQGFKVGIVEQTETAALKKVSDTRNAVFERALTHVYTSATFVDELDSVDDVDRQAPLLMCLAEEPAGGMGADERVGVGMVVVCPSTGDVVWDYFTDNHMRTELETRMVHVKPDELCVPERGLSKPTRRMLQYFVGHATSEHKIRVEHFKEALVYSEAFDRVSEFYTAKEKAGASGDFASGKLMEVIAGFPKLVAVALAHCIDYLSAYNIADALTRTKFFAQFTTQEHMLLNGNTVTNLEIFQNDTDFSKNGSLLWILDKTLTKFGARLLRGWVGKPLTNAALLRERTDAMEEAMEGASQRLLLLRGALRKLPDLAKGLCRMQYGKCTPKELAALLEAFTRVAHIFGAGDTGAEPLRAALWRDIMGALPRLRAPLQEIVDCVRLDKAAAGNKVEMWADPERYEGIADADFGMQAVETELEDELVKIRKILKIPSLKWTSVLFDEFLVEYSRANDQTRIPEDWILHGSTKKVRRYYTPRVKAKLAERARFAEQRTAAANAAFARFLQETVAKHYAVLRDTVNKLAVADCLFALATVSLTPGYVRAEFVEDGNDVLEIADGRHPMAEALRADPFQPNSLGLGGGAPGCTIITGPNMGGKSSTVRMVALLAVMAQIGCYVPAASMRLNMLDSVLTRMGASDELARGRSTFMVEMSETSDILATASPRSLVILDELGRGTSTFDGMAIAQAVLQHLVTATRCKTLFITHYPAVAAALAARFPQDIRNAHMGFHADARLDGTRDITFLYKLTDGLAESSFGIECARLAGLPDDVLCLARAKAEGMQESVEKRRRWNRARQSVLRLKTCLDGSLAPGSRKTALLQLANLATDLKDV